MRKLVPYIDPCFHKFSHRECFYYFFFLHEKKGGVCCRWKTGVACTGVAGGGTDLGSFLLG